MKRDFEIGLLIGSLINITLAVLAICAWSDKWKTEAVEKGHAEFYLDKEHQKQWRWK